MTFLNLNQKQYKKAIPWDDFENQLHSALTQSLNCQKSLNRVMEEDTITTKATEEEEEVAEDEADTADLKPLEDTETQTGEAQILSGINSERKTIQLVIYLLEVGRLSSSENRHPLRSNNNAL